MVRITMQLSLKEMLLINLEGKRDFIHGGELERYGQGQGYMASNVGRRLRELARAGKLEVIYELNNNTHVREAWYRLAK